MNQSEQCKLLHKKYAELTDLKNEFFLGYEKSKKTGTLDKAKELKKEIESVMEEIKENLNPFERELKMREQYEGQRDILEKAGLLADGKIIGIDGKEYPYPEYSEITKMMREKKEMLETKVKQGFERLVITPFGMKMEDLVKALKKALIKHHKEGKLLATKKDSADKDEPLELKENEPVYVWDEWKEENTVYFPQSLTTENHGGKTKQEILDEQNKEESPFAGYLISLIESNPNIPREGKGKTISGRKQIEANKTSEQYMEMLQNNSQYTGERGKALEEWIILLLTKLEESNEVIDDYWGNGSANYCIGNLNPSSRNVGYACWYRYNQQANVSGCDPDFPVDVDGLSSAVGLNT